MNASIVRGLEYGVVLGCLGLMVSACNTTKATTDTTVNFFSSTSPNDLFTQEGLVREDQKVPFYAFVAFDNLQQDMARGGGEYLTSLGVLMHVPADRQGEWEASLQSRYAELVPASQTQAPEMLARLNATPDHQ